MEQKEIKLPQFSGEFLKDYPGSYLITTDGTIKSISPQDGKLYSLKEMYEYCGTDIVEFVYLPFDRILVVDEEGALKSNRKQNWVATKIVADAVAAAGGCLDYFIYGNVMLVKESEVE